MLINLERTPSESFFNEHYFCDYIELLALVANCDPVSKNDIYDRFQEDGKISTSGSDDNYEEEDKWDIKFNGLFNILESRKNIFLDFYPFQISNNNTSLSVKLLQEITNKQKIYIFLLLNSLQRYLSKSNCSILTSDFEEFSLKAFKEYIPITGQIYRFGKSGLEFDRYRGHITDKIDKFAQDLTYKTIYDAHFFANTDNGDGGLDIVSWIPFENDTNYNNIQIYLGQCATGKNWLDKKDDTDKFHNFIHFKGAVQNIMFIPYDGRNNDRKFNEEAKMNRHLFLDRSRLLYLIKSKENDILTLNSFQNIVDSVISYEEDII